MIICIMINDHDSRSRLANKFHVRTNRTIATYFQLRWSTKPHMAKTRSFLKL